METRKRNMIPGLCRECVRFSPSKKSEQIIRNETLMKCAEVGHVKCVKACLNAGTDVNSIYDFCTPLTCAAENGHVDCVRLLIEAGADVNTQNDDGKTALMFTAKNGYAKCVDILLAAGADVTMASKRGRTALMLAAELDHPLTVDLLIKAGAEVNKIDRFGRTALMHASPNETCMAILILAGADVNVQDRHGETALMWVTESCHAKQLLRAGAEINIKNVNCLNALAKNVLSKNIAVALVLFAAGETVDGNSVMRDERGNFISLVSVPDYLKHKDLDMNLKHLCRETIRKHLLQLNQVNLFYKVPRLGLPTPLQEYLLYNESIGSPIMITARPGAQSTSSTFEPTDYVPVPYYLLLRMNLKHLCRETIRKHLTNLDPQQLLSLTVPQLGLPRSLAEYVLYYKIIDRGTENNDDDDDDDSEEIVDHPIKTGAKSKGKHRCSIC